VYDLVQFCSRLSDSFSLPTASRSNRSSSTSLSTLRVTSICYGPFTSSRSCTSRSSRSSSSPPLPTLSTLCSTTTAPPTTQISTRSRCNTCWARARCWLLYSHTTTRFQRYEYITRYLICGEANNARFSGPSPSGLSRSRSCRNCSCCSGQARQRQSLRTTSSH
jgi:hypothetical protein